MKKLIAAFAGLMMMVASATSYGLESNGWRLNIDASADGETPVVVTEIEFLTSADPAVDGTLADLGVDVGVCGWRCDSISTNRQGTPSSDYPGETRSRRQVRVAFDNSFSTYFTLNDKTTEFETYYIQYHFYTGVTDPVRVRADVTSYSVTVPASSIDAGAPVSWTFEYIDSSINAWAALSTVTSDDVNWTTSGKIYSRTAVFYLVDTVDGETRTRVWDGSDWSAALDANSTPTLTEATAAVSEGELVARHLEFTF